MRVPDPNHQGRTIQKCTTGQPDVDTTTIGSGNYEFLKAMGYEYNGIYKSDGTTHADNPVPKGLNNNGDIGQYEWESSTPNQVNHMFFAMNWFDPNGPQAGNDFTQKQGTLQFDEQSKKCIMIRWDPRGVVFDSKSLKPVAGAEVTLLKKLGNGQFVPVTSDDVLGGGLENPFITKDDGAFVFYVPDGTYKLSIKKNNYIYPAQVTSTDLYGKYTNIYYGQEFTQKGQIHEYNIPLDPDIKSMIFDRFSSLIHNAVSIFIK